MKVLENHCTREVSVLQRHNAAQLHNRLPMFRGNAVVSRPRVGKRLASGVASCNLKNGNLNRTAVKTQKLAVTRMFKKS